VTAGVTWGALFALSISLTGFSLGAIPYFLRLGRYRLAAGAAVLRTSAAVAAQVCFGLLWASALSLFAGFVAGVLAQVALLAAVLRYQAPPSPPKWRRMIAVVRRYRRQISVDVPSTIIAVLSQNLLTFSLSLLFGRQVVGYFSLGQRIALMPLQLFNDSLGKVYFQSAAQADRETGHFWTQMRLSLLASGFLSAAVVIAVWLFAQPFVAAFLGREWLPAATIMMVLIPALAVRSVCSSLASSVFVLQRPDWLLAHNIANSVLQIGAFLVALAFGLDLTSFLFLVAALVFVENVCFTALLVKAAKQRRIAVAAA
jgi:O-antigen/teichoic acid export membrane protein